MKKRIWAVVLAALLLAALLAGCSGKSENSAGSDSADSGGAGWGQENGFAPEDGVTDEMNQTETDKIIYTG